MFFKQEEAHIISKDKMQELSNWLCKRSKLENISKRAKKETPCKPQSTENLLNAYEPTTVQKGSDSQILSTKIFNFQLCPLKKNYVPQDLNMQRTSPSTFEWSSLPTRAN